MASRVKGQHSCIAVISLTSALTSEASSPRPTLVALALSHSYSVPGSCFVLVSALTVLFSQPPCPDSQCNSDRQHAQFTSPLLVNFLCTAHAPCEQLLTFPHLLSACCRRVSEFLDLNTFKPPRDQSEAIERIQLNLAYYALNYVLLYTLFLLFLSIQQPSFLFTSLALAATGYYLFRMRTDRIVLGSVALTEDQVRAGYGVVSVLLFLYVGGWPMVYVTAVAALISLVHAAMRQRSIKSRGSVTLATARDSIKREVNDMKRDLNTKRY